MNLLIVDDDHIVGSVVRHILEREGHTVTIAHSGAEGTFAFEQQHETVDLIVIDMVLPDGSGVDVLRDMRLIEPQVPCLVCSGVGAGLEDIPIELRGRTDFLRKPFLSDELVAAVSKILVPVPG
jgi:DNA-binding response OmpR family regulator